MPRQALAMTWDFAEGNPLGKSSVDVTTCLNAVTNYLDSYESTVDARAFQSDAQSGIDTTQQFIISTDPPYYDNISYADLSDYFYVWLRRSVKTIFPQLFATIAVPKSNELIAAAHRHGSKEAA
jgi:putative DNA methylase